jgi:hypothetical protein
MREGVDSVLLQQSTLGSAFDNALRCLQPDGHLVGTSLVPPTRHRSEPSLLAFALETEPAIAELACNRHGSSEGSSAAFRSSAAVEPKFTLGVDGRSYPSIDLSSLRRRGRDEPYFPPLARRVEKSPVTHRHVLRRNRAPKCVCYNVHFAGRVPPFVYFGVIRRGNHTRCTYVFFLESLHTLLSSVDFPSRIEMIEIQ